MHRIINSDNSDIHLMDIHLMIQWFCVTLSLQAGVFKTPGGCFKADKKRKKTARHQMLAVFFILLCHSKFKNFIP